VSRGIYFPSKLADYIAANKPILALSPREGTVATLASSGELIRVDHDADAVKNALSRLYAAFKAGTLSLCCPSTGFRMELEGRGVATKFLKACHNVIERRVAKARFRMESAALPHVADGSLGQE
jgi:hypothetical protein